MREGYGRAWWQIKFYLILLQLKLSIMTDVAGVSTLKNEEGKVTHITFEVDKHKDFLQPILKDLGIVEKTRFRQDFEKGLTIEEARKDMIEHINNLYAGNR